MPFKRKTPSGARKTGRLGRKYVKTAVKKRKMQFSNRLAKRVKRIERTIETKEGLRTFSGTNLALPHNNIVSLSGTLLWTNYGTNDPMADIGQRIGDQVYLKGLGIKLFIQNQAERPKVYYRVMVIKSAKGDAPTRATLFKGLVGNKMIDQLNTERYTVLASKRVTATCVGNSAWTTTNLSGVPRTENGATQIGGVGTKIVSMWIPGRKFTKGGVIQYESGTTQPKFFDYHLIIMAYDWFGTPQDVNNVGAVSDGWIKQYFTDA